MKKRLKPQVFPSTSSKGKRKLDLQGESSKGQSPRKRRHNEAPPDREEIILSDVMKIMESVHEELNNQDNTKLNKFLRTKINDLKTDKREVIGVFGRTGAGKSSLINVIIGEENLLPTADDGACTSVMIKVESNPNNSKYEADIEFITKKEWEDEVWLMKQFHDNNTDQEHEEDQEDDDDDDDKEDDDDEDDEDDEDDDDDDDDDDDKMSAVYGDGWKDKISENLMDKKYFQAIPEFLESKKKTLTCDSAEDLSAEIVNYIRSDSSDGDGNKVTRCYWPLVKCVTIEVPNKDLLKHVTLVDLPGSGDRNKSRDKMWKEIVRDCSTVWIVADINRAASDKEAWQILEDTSSFMGNGGQCQQIHFICTKSDDIKDSRSAADVRGRILQRNEKVKKKVEHNFSKNKKIKKHFSDDCFKVFTVSAQEFVSRKHLNPEDTEIKELQHCLRDLNDCHSVTLNYVSGAYGILSLMKAANCTTSQNTKVCRDLEGNLRRGLSKVSKPLDEAYKKFDKRLKLGVQKSKTSWKKTLKSVLHPRGVSGRAFHKTLKCVVENGGIHETKKKKQKKEININMKLASHLTSSIDEDFKKTFPNGKCGPINGVISKFTLHTDELIQKYKDVELQLKFLKTEEEKIQTELNKIIQKRKKTMYNSLTATIEENMQECYEEAKLCTGEGSLKKMRDTIEKHVRDNTKMFEMAKAEMLKQLEDLKTKITETLQKTLEESTENSLKTDDSLTPDVAAELEEVKEYYKELKPSSEK